MPQFLDTYHALLISYQDNVVFLLYILKQSLSDIKLDNSFKIRQYFTIHIQLS